MHIRWHISQGDKDAVLVLIKSQEGTALVQDRRERNLAKRKEHLTKKRLWRAIVCMRLTTQARSGPTGKLANFQQLKPFPLDYRTCTKKISSLEDFILHTLRKYQVGRHPHTISKQLASNLKSLEGGNWNTLINKCNRLTSQVSREVESEAADFVADMLEGFGPKQSRNLLQVLGLTRFEIPIDSRVTAWLNEALKLPFKVTSTALADRGYYSLVSDAICELCESCGEFPCILDAAIFGSNDGDRWTKKQLVY